MGDGRYTRVTCRSGAHRRGSVVGDAACAGSKNRHDDLPGDFRNIAAGLVRMWQCPVPRPPFGLRPGRSRLLTEAAWLSTAFLRRRPLASGLELVAKLAAALAVAVTLVLPLSSEIVRAARGSSPGHVLYPLKIHVERVQYAGTDQPDVRVALTLAFLGERVAESQSLVHGQQPLGEAIAAEAQQLTYQLLRAVAETPETALPEVLEYVRLQIGNYLAVLTALEPMAGDDAPHVASMAQACRRAYLVTTRALTYPEEFQDAYRAGRPELFLLPGERPLNGGTPQ